MITLLAGAVAVYGTALVIGFARVLLGVSLGINLKNLVAEQLFETRVRSDIARRRPEPPCAGR